MLSNLTTTNLILPVDLIFGPVLPVQINVQFVQMGQSLNQHIQNFVDDLRCVAEKCFIYNIKVNVRHGLLISHQLGTKPGATPNVGPRGYPS
jgi:hypothetical protein